MFKDSEFLTFWSNFDQRNGPRYRRLCFPTHTFKLFRRVKCHPWNCFNWNLFQVLALSTKTIRVSNRDVFFHLKLIAEVQFFSVCIYMVDIGLQCTQSRKTTLRSDSEVMHLMCGTKRHDCGTTISWILNWSISCWYSRHELSTANLPQYNNSRTVSESHIILICQT